MATIIKLELDALVMARQTLKIVAKLFHSLKGKECGLDIGVEFRSLMVLATSMVQNRDIPCSNVCNRS